MSSDYSGQEQWILTDQCRDPLLIDSKFNGDGDFHSLMATRLVALLTGEEIIINKKNNPMSPFGKSWRDTGKMINLGLNYGLSAFSLEKDLGLSKEAAEALHKSATDAFPVKKEYFNKIIRKYLNLGYVLINEVTNRRRYLKDYKKYLEYLDIKKSRQLRKDQWRAYNKMEGEYSRIIMNSPTQGTAGDMTKLALVLIRKCLIHKYNMLPTKDAPVKLIGVVHDEILLEVRDDYVDRIKVDVERIMIFAGKVFCKIIPMDVETKINNFWEH